MILWTENAIESAKSYTRQNLSGSDYKIMNYVLLGKLQVSRIIPKGSNVLKHIVFISNL